MGATILVQKVSFTGSLVLSNSTKGLRPALVVIGSNVSCLKMDWGIKLVKIVIYLTSCFILPDSLLILEDGVFIS